MMPNSFAQKIGDRLKAARERAGLSQGRLAALLDMSQQGYAHFESGRNTIGLEHILRVCQILKCPLSELLPNEYVASIDLVATDPRLSELLAAWPSLTETQRHAFQSMLQGFIENNPLSQGHDDETNRRSTRT